VKNELKQIDIHTGRDNSIPSKDFLHKRLDVRKGVAVSEGREAIRTDDGIDLSLSLLLDIRKECHGQEKRVD